MSAGDSRPESSSASAASQSTAAGPSSNSTKHIRAMQLFHELKQKFPTFPDHVVSACISEHHANTNSNPVAVLKNSQVPRTQPYPAALMGKRLPSMDQDLVDDAASSSVPSLTSASAYFSKKLESVCVSSSKTVGNSCFYTRPTSLSLRSAPPPSLGSFSSIQTSERVSANLDKLLVSDKPPRSPVSPAGKKIHHHLLKKTTTTHIAEEKGNGNNHLQQKVTSLETIHPGSNAGSRRVNQNQSHRGYTNENGQPAQCAHHSNVKYLQQQQQKLLEETPVHQGAPNSAFGSSSSSEEQKTQSVVCNNESVKVKRRSTVETPTQTDPHPLHPPVSEPSVNLSLNVNCSMLPSPTSCVPSLLQQRHSTELQVTPQQPWCTGFQSSELLSSPPRSYTSVNLTLRPPTSDRQPPIDICSANSSLTYSTSSFDSQNGFQSRLQITVGAGGTGTVSSLRMRPRSSYLPNEIPGVNTGHTLPARAGSMPHLVSHCPEASQLVSKQEARIERLQIELVTEKSRLMAIQNEVAALTTSQRACTEQEEREKERQLKKQIKRLQTQCERLVQQVDQQAEYRVQRQMQQQQLQQFHHHHQQQEEGGSGRTTTTEEFYSRLYTGQRGSVGTTPSSLLHGQVEPVPSSADCGEPWACHMCTFQNHPLLLKCEQCEMPRILHGRKSEPPNPCLPSVAFNSSSLLGSRV